MSEKAANTRRKLLEAAASVFSERGYARATTKEIAKAAGVSEGTIYRHFEDKRELFQAAFAERSAASSEELVKLPELAGTATVRENLRRLVQVIEDAEENIAPLQASAWSDSELGAVLSASAPEGAARSAGPVLPLAAYLAAEQELGRIRADVDVERAAFALFAIPFASAMTARMARASGREADMDIMGAVDVVLRGLEP
jgi:AcrR family transcriptional regulator